MKKVYVEELKQLSPLNRKNYCTCGDHGPILVHQLEPLTNTPWYVRCPTCGRESLPSSTKADAIFLWRYVTNTMVSHYYL